MPPRLLNYLKQYYLRKVCLSICPYVPMSRPPKFFPYFQKPSQTYGTRGEAELNILNFKTTWLEFQRPIQTTAEQGNAELRILNFKTTWLEFQKPSQTAAERSLSSKRDSLKQISAQNSNFEQN